MSAGDLIAAARAAGVHLSVEGRRLRFRAPQGALSDELRAAVRDRRDDIVRALRREAAARAERGPIAANQQGMWFLQRLAPESAAYNIALAVRIRGGVRDAQVEEALQILVDRHESLRTTYPVLDGTPVREVPGSRLVAFAAVDLGGASEAEVREAVERDYAVPFDLERGPVFRARLYRVTDDLHVLLLVAHHIALDGTALFVLFEEFAELYAALDAGSPVPARRGGAEYGEFVKWQAELLEGAEADRAYWARVLDPPPPALELPLDRPRPATPGLRGRSLSRHLDPALSEALRRLARSEGTTEYVVMLSLWFAFLRRITGQADLSVGSPVHGRASERFSRTVGDLINVIPLRVREVSGVGFRDLLGVVRDTVLAAMEHQDYPLPRMVEERSRPGGAPGAPFHTALLFQDFGRFGALERCVLAGEDEWIQVGALTLSGFPIDQQAGQFDLSLDVWRRDGVFGCVWKYDTDLLDGATVEQWADAFAVMCAAIVADPDVRVETVPLTGGGVERHAVAGDPLELPAGDVVDLVRRSVAAHPGRVAAEDGARALTYAELDEAARALAATLAARGVGPGDRVGISTDRTVDLVVSVLGVWYAGATYVPLDPAFPEARLRYMVGHAAIRTVVADARGREACGRWLDAAVAVVDPASRAHPPLDAPVRAGAEALAYVLYTSGSTGTPKGVAVPHRAVVNFLLSMARRPGFGEGDTLVAVTTLSFDISVLELLLPLVAGARVVVAPSDAVGDGAGLAALLDRSGATVMQATPATWRILLDAGWRPARPFAALCGGEALTRHLADQLLATGATVWNLYGPTETTVWSTVGRVEAGTRAPDLGRPIHNTQLYVMDESGNPMPAGAPGELWIGGAGVARGYLDDPERTAAAFVEELPGAGRVYRTGDLVRRAADGSLSFLGRRDQQIKVRGFRIEAGEVESALLRHPRVRNAAVGASTDERGSTTLVAWLETGSEGPVDPAELRAFLAGQLPAYMVPTAWVALDRLPLTPNGKVDRKSLPAPTRERRDAGTAPSTATERAVAAIWSEILGIDDVRLEDDFFVLGGHSLNATQLVARVRDRFELELPLRRFFDAPTLGATVDWIRSEGVERGGLPAITPCADPDRAPLSFSQERMWVVESLTPGSVAYNMAGAVHLDGELDLDRLRAAFDVVSARQESLRTRIVADRGQPFQRVDAAPTHLFLVEDASHLPEASRLPGAARRAVELLEEPYDLAAGPLTRVLVVRLGERSHLLAVGMHHVVSDMWSFGIFGRELAAAYDDPANPALPDLPAHYRDYATWQRRWLSGGALDEQLRYWTERLAGVPTLELPTDFARPRFYSHEGGWVRAELRPELAESLRRLSARHRATPFMTLLAALNALLHAHSRQTDLAVGVPIANRTQTATESLIGTFVNTLVHRNDLSGEPTFVELLGRVRATALEAFANQDTPFELLVKELAPARETSRTPLFQVLFNVGNVRVDRGDTAAWKRTAVPLERRTSQFELTVDVGLNELQSDVSFSYNGTLFERGTVERLLAHYMEILERVAADPEIRLSELAAVSTADAGRLLEAFNDTRRDYPAAANVPELFAAQAERAPGRVAVSSAAGAWTYAELREEAQRVTAALQGLGVRPGDRVGLLMERGREMLAALLGILGAGAAYVPVDPTYPESRVRYMLENSAAAALVTHRGLERRYALDLPVLDLDRWSRPAPAPFVATDPRQAAYVIYTSGSTGLPKGVEVPHGAMVNFLCAMADAPGLGAEDRVLAVTTISFDIAVLELYLPLLVGARVAIAEVEETTDGRRLAERMEREGITLMQATPATWKLLIAAGWRGSPRLRILCGGEPLPRALADDLLDRSAELWNMYGPTETTVWSTVERVEREGPITIGRPIANTTVYVLDEARRPVPIGVPGELYIGGDGVANGYMNRPDLTAERFLESPFRPGERIYRTGDKARFLGDGRLEHLGRLDHQVKVRGFRIELGEVESALRAHAAVRDVAVVAREDRLVAYVVAEPGEAVAAGELRRWAGESLPAYMVPSLYVALEALPLTPNGKVDRKALPEPTEEAREEGPASLPADPREKVIAEVWASLLGLDEVEVTDNFFELGGHSLLAMQAVALVEERTGYRLEPRSLFFSSLGELAELLPDPGAPQA